MANIPSTLIVQECTRAKNMAIFSELSYELQSHRPFPPNPADYFLYRNMKKWFGGRRFGSNDKIIVLPNAHFGDIDESFYLKGINKFANNVLPIQFSFGFYHVFCALSGA